MQILINKTLQQGSLLAISQGDTCMHALNISSHIKMPSDFGIRAELKEKGKKQDIRLPNEVTLFALVLHSCLQSITHQAAVDRSAEDEGIEVDMPSIG